MRMLKVLCCAAAIAATTAPLAHAQNNNQSKKTFLTFSGPVQIPGKTLAAGTYTFRVADLLADRHVLQILDKDEKDLIATVMTVPDRRVETSKDNVVMFSERPAGSAPAVKMWYYPGVETGNEFVYPRAQAMQIAKASHTSVLARSDESASDAEMKTAKITRIDETGAEVSDSGERQVAANTSQAPAPSTPASVGTTGQAPASASPSQSTPAPAATRRTELPRTASNLVLFELLSALTAAGYLVARRARKSQEQV
jgi:hypothetical protein